MNVGGSVGPAGTRSKLGPVIQRIHTYSWNARIAPPTAAQTLHRRDLGLRLRTECRVAERLGENGLLPARQIAHDTVSSALDDRMNLRAPLEVADAPKIYQPVSQMTKGSKICGKIAAWSSPGRASDASNARARCCWMPQSRCSPKKVSSSATLDDIAKAAGYSKGAIYKYFATKEDLFLAASDRYWRRYFDNFAEVMSSSDHIGARELEDIAERWRQLSRDRGAEHAALGIEFNLYLLRNPEARERVAAKRSEVVDQLATLHRRGYRESRRDPVDPCGDVRPHHHRHDRRRRTGQSPRRCRSVPGDLEMYVSAVKMP